MGQIKFAGALLMAGLFAFAILSYVNGFGVDNDVAIDIEGEQGLNQTRNNIENEMYTFKEDTNASIGAFDKSEISAGDDTTRTGGVFKSNNRALFSGVGEILGLGWEKIFGGGEDEKGFGVVLTAILSFFALLVVLYGWKTWKGNPD